MRKGAREWWAGMEAVMVMDSDGVDGVDGWERGMVQRGAGEERNGG